MPFLSCSSGNPHTLLIPVDNFLLPLVTFMITTLSLLNSFFSDNKARWQAWGLMLDYTLIFVLFLGSGLPRGNPSLVDVSPPWIELPPLYPSLWGSTVFSLQQGLWFLIGTIILTVGILLRYSFTTFPPIPTLIKKWGLFGIGVFIQEACFFTYFMGAYGFMGPYEGAALGFFAIYHVTSWLGLLAISLLVYAGCTRDIKLHTFGLLFTTVFTFYMYYLSKAKVHIPEVVLIMFLGLPLYGLGVFFTGVSLLEKLSISLSQIQERMAKNQDFVLLTLLFLCFLFTTPSPTFLILDDLLYGWLPPAVKKIGKFPYFQQNLIVGLIICTFLFMLPARKETFSLTKRETVRRALIWFGMTTLFILLVYMKGYPESITIRATFPFL
ncbi:MAG: hypothetical protein GWN17_00205 [Candidatus Korarchaeota archaeon]|nr:hypothetical protein [Candidatus Korarchaeota archaeon]